ncbi:MAG: FliA/WhiG family RNA polymerase sigma factor [Planctomycetota bacterium]
MPQTKKQIARTNTLRRKSAKSCRDYATLTLDKSRRRHFASPVSSPLIFHHAPTSKVLSSDQIVKQTPEQSARAQVRATRRQHEKQLWQHYFKEHSDDARNALWVHYQLLVRYLAEGVKAKLPENIDVHDLISAGNIGLQDAITKFEPKMKVRFESYCVSRIRGAILDSIRNLDWVPRMIRNKIHQLERIVREMAMELRREPKDEEVAARLNMNLQQYHELQRELNVKAQISVKSGGFDPHDERNMLRLEMLKTPREIEPTSELQREEIRQIAFDNLKNHERFVIEQYYFHGHSMKQIGDDLRLSESRICQIHAQVLILLKRKFRAYEESCEF